MARDGKLAAQHDRLRAELADAHGVIAGQATVIEALRETNTGLTARVAELEARLGQNSRNSSRPPSSDGYAKPAPKPRPRCSGRRPGKQPGAAGKHLAQTPQPDEVVVHTPVGCVGCGGDLEAAEVVGAETRQVFDVPPARLVATEHRAERRRCGCGTTTTAAFPAEARAPACYGSGVRALAAYLVVCQHLPYERAARCLADVCGASVSVGAVQQMVAEAAAGVAPFTAAVREALAAADVAHFDETGARVDGTLEWIHSASTAWLTLYALHPKRGKDAMDAAGVLPAFAGVAVHDGWASYRRYADIAHGLCNAHHLRELAAAADDAAQGWASDMTDLLIDAKAAVDAAGAAGEDRLDAAVLADLGRRYEAIVAAGHAANPPPPRSGKRGRTKKSKAANLLARLDVYRADVLRFTVNFAVSFDNNQAERDVRMVKLQQKISGCWRTRAGGERFLAIRSYLSTARKQGVGALDVLQQVFQGGCWLPQPAPT